MGKKQKILEFRERLDKTLASHVLSNDESIKTLVKNQLLRSSPSEIQGNIENVVEKRAMEVRNFLDMLRSASGNDSKVSKIRGTSNGDWKSKQDNDEYRVMYREGLQGTPFHTLLLEGYADGPVDVCLCVGWESALYKKWWPHFYIPTFKTMASNCLQKIRIGEQIALARMKVPWPMSTREVVLPYFELEYFEDDLVIVLLNTDCNGFTNDGIPEAKDAVRMDLVGGFVLQKLTSNRSYFRTIATMDIKLDFVPPSLINFISRQLMGSACKLYQKEVVSVVKGDEDFAKALEDPLYVRIREGLNPESKLKKTPEPEPEPEPLKSEKSRDILHEQNAIETLRGDILDKAKMSLQNHHAIKIPLVNDHTSLGEINEEEIVQESHIKQCNVSKEVFINPKVEHALSILDNAVHMVRRG